MPNKELIIPKKFECLTSLHFLAFDTLNSKMAEMKVDNENFSSFETIEELINGDFDLQIYHAEDLIVYIDAIQKGIFFTEGDLERAITISNLSDEDAMALYAKHGIFHDGGDDFDYGQSFPGILFDVMKACVDDESIESLCH